MGRDAVMDRHRVAVRTVESSAALLPAEAAGESESEPEPASAWLNTAILLWRQRGILWRVTAGGGLLTLLMACLIPNRYQSTTHLMSPEMRGSSSEMAMVAGLLAKTGGGIGGLTSNLLGVSNAGDLLVGVLRSRSVGDTLVKKFDLKKVYAVGTDEDAREQLGEQTEISQERKSGIITIAVVDRTPRRAAEMARAYVDELNGLLVEVNTSAAHRERLFIEERLKVVKQDLDAAAIRLSDFSTKNTALDPKEQGRAMVGAAVALQGELIAHETELRGVQQIYTDNNVRVKSLKARVAELRRQLEDLRGADSESSAGPENKEESLYPNFRRLPALNVAYADRYREVKLQEAVFETLTQQYELVKIAEAKEIPSVKVLDEANVPERKWGPHRAVLAFLGGVTGALFGCIWVIAAGSWQRLAADDPCKALAEEVLDSLRRHWLWRRSSSVLGRASSAARYVFSRNGSLPE